MQLPDRNASGARYVLWHHRVDATFCAHLELNDGLSAPQRTALTTEKQVIGEKAAVVETAYEAYHRFNVTAFIRIAANQAVANYLGDVALEDVRGQLMSKKRDAEQAVPGILTRLTEGFQFNKALIAGHATSVVILSHAADIVSLLPNGPFGFADAAEASLRKAATRLDGFNQERHTLETTKRAELRTAVERAILDLRETVLQANGRLRTHFSERFIDSLYPQLDKSGRPTGDDDTDDEPAAPAATPPTP